VPALVGLGAPYWDQNARGAIYGITRGTHANHIVRAAVEAMCYQTKDVVDAMEKDSALRIKSLKVDGGAVVNNLLCQFQADLLGIDVVRPRIVEITSLGAAYLAGLAVGYWKDAGEIKRCWAADRIFRPKMPRALASRLYAGWCDSIERTLTR
jgi:glycerol kinase